MIPQPVEHSSNHSHADGDPPMLIVINEFHIEPSKIKQATEAAKAAQAQVGKLGHSRTRFSPTSPVNFIR
jgi:hypothetical protein